jgi:hypothetical protein
VAWQSHSYSGTDIRLQGTLGGSTKCSRGVRNVDKTGNADASERHGCEPALGFRRCKCQSPPEPSAVDDAVVEQSMCA